MTSPLPNVAPIRREPLAAEVARRLVDYLLSGGVAPGARIPSERQLAEAFGVEDRGSFYDAVGALKDVVQNHMMQVVALLAMEPPTSASAHCLHEEQVKVFASMRPIAGSVLPFICWTSSLCAGSLLAGNASLR